MSFLFLIFIQYSFCFRINFNLNYIKTSINHFTDTDCSFFNLKKNKSIKIVKHLYSFIAHLVSQ
jgi:hypothetical protein